MAVLGRRRAGTFCRRRKAICGRQPAMRACRAQRSLPSFDTGTTKMKIEGSVICNGKATKNVSLQIKKFEESDDTEWSCDLEFSEPFSKKMIIFGADRRNLILCIMIFLNGTLEE